MDDHSARILPGRRTNKTVILAGIVEAALHSAAVVDGMKFGAFGQDLATSIVCGLMIQAMTESENGP